MVTACARVLYTRLAVAGAAVGTMAACLLGVWIARRPMSPGALTGRTALVRHPPTGLPAAARGMVERALGGSDRAFFVRPTVGGFALRDARAGVAARFGRGGAAVG
jgi:Na+/glutamate symporter